MLPETRITMVEQASRDFDGKVTEDIPAASLISPSTTDCYAHVKGSYSIPSGCLNPHHDDRRHQGLSSFRLLVRHDLVTTSNVPSNRLGIRRMTERRQIGPVGERRTPLVTILADLLPSDRRVAPTGD